MAQFVQYKKMTTQTYKSIKYDFGDSKKHHLQNTA